MDGWSQLEKLFDHTLWIRWQNETWLWKSNRDQDTGPTASEQECI